jgi:hypothetical protein
VAFTSGHTTPVADLMVVSPEKKTMFLVDVKGLYPKNQFRPDDTNSIAAARGVTC